MRRCIGLAAVGVVVMGMGLGCGSTGHRDAPESSMARPMYDKPYVAVRDSEWMQTQTSTTRNRLAKGTRAYFADSLTSSEWQQARVEGQGVVWVHPGDFAREAR
jgi:hypothetical protein